MRTNERPGSWFWFFYFMVSIAVIGGIGAYLVAMPLYLVGLMIPAFRRAGDTVLVSGIRLLLWFQPWLGGNVALQYPRDLGTQGCLLVSNHRSHLDAFLLLSRLKGVRIFARKSLFRIPFLGWMMELTRQIPAERGNIKVFFEANAEIRRRLRSGERVHVFPEMTRCSKGFAGSQDFILAPFHLAIQEKVSIVPVVFKDTDLVWPKGDLRLRFRPSFTVQTLTPIKSTDFANADSLRNETKRRIDQALSAT